jgi:hypothetical protein
MLADAGHAQTSATRASTTKRRGVRRFSERFNGELVQPTARLNFGLAW